MVVADPAGEAPKEWGGEERDFLRPKGQKEGPKKSLGAAPRPARPSKPSWSPPISPPPFFNNRSLLKK